VWVDKLTIKTGENKKYSREFLLLSRVSRIKKVCFIMSLPPTFVKGFHYEEQISRMEYQRLGSTHMYVSKISIGGGTLCDSFYGKLDFDEAKRTVIEAFKRGINYIDTAVFYGQGESESNIGKILKDVPRQAYYIATKTCRFERTGEGQFDFGYERTMKSVDESLKRLGVDYIDLYQLHDVEFADSIDEVINGAFRACLELKKEGKIRAIGINGYPLSVLKEGIIKGEKKFNTVLSYARYILTDDTLLEYMPFFEEMEVGVICAAIQAMGMLTNREPPVWHPADPRLKAIVKEAAEICKKNDVQLGKLAVHHSMNIPGGKVATFLMGMEKMEYLNYNMSAYLDGLTAKEMEIYELLMRE
jgi:aryl-alcohol dehydrogenase-like predicted oxidoreductase